MTHHKKFNKESQDARRRDQHNTTHPDEKIGSHVDKSGQNHGTHTPNKRKI